MRLILFIAAIVTGGFAFFLTNLAGNTGGQVYGAMFWIITAILAVGGAIVGAVVAAGRRIEDVVRDSTVRVEKIVVRDEKIYRIKEAA